MTDLLALLQENFIEYYAVPLIAKNSHWACWKFSTATP
jgi:hypothetical protein